MSDREHRPGRPTAARKADRQPDTARNRQRNNRSRQTAVSLWGDEDGEPDAVDARLEPPRVAPASALESELAESRAASGGDAHDDTARTGDIEVQPLPSRGGVPPVSPIAMDPETTSRTLQASGPVARPFLTPKMVRLRSVSHDVARARARLYPSPLRRRRGYGTSTQRGHRRVPIPAP